MAEKKLQSDQRVRVRLQCDVAAYAAKSSIRNGRTLPQEINHILREYYNSDRRRAGYFTPKPSRLHRNETSRLTTLHEL